MLEVFDTIYIQCHDVPDADSIGSGYALYEYFHRKGKQVTLFYSGKQAIQKINLVSLVKELEIPIQHIPKKELKRQEPLKGILITVDCHYGEGNVTKFLAEEIAIIDHHPVERIQYPLSCIKSNYGSCATVVWQLMKREGFSFLEEGNIGTALYYGLFSDTDRFSELRSPQDKDMRDSLPHRKSLINQFKNNNFSIEELQTAGIALIRRMYNEKYRYAIVQAEPCDPNLLGVISDFLLQVNGIDTCVIYTKVGGGYKFSVRSCSIEARASELAEYLSLGMGSSGGHLSKAGGFVPSDKYKLLYPSLHSEAAFGERLNEYFESFDVIYSDEAQIDTVGMKVYKKRKIELGFVKMEEILPIGTPITIRSLEGDYELNIDPNHNIIIGVKGEIHPISKGKFAVGYKELEQKFDLELEYTPTIINRYTGLAKEITDYAHSCIPTGEVHIHVKKITRPTKVFTIWDEESYMYGKPDDYLAIDCKNTKDIYIIDQEVFTQTYKEV